MSDLTYALAEEIGDPDLFVGRKSEMARLMKWAEGTRRRLSKSMAILSRRKKGKTALLQRFFNVLYTRGLDTRNDPQLIPFYYRVKEHRLPKRAFAEELYRSLLSQYFAFTTRTPELVGQVLSLGELRELAQDDRHVAADLHRMEDILERSPDLAWSYAQDVGHRISQLNDVRIIQILDEFQYMNRWIVSDDNRDRVELLCHSYMGTAESKFSPQIVAGSYIGWLTAILTHMTSRYREWHLEGLADEEALEAVYNYAYAYQVPITDEVAPHIAEVCDNDPFYIAATVSHRPEEKDLTTAEGAREALAFETVMGQGDIARVWHEYLADAFARINDTNARKIVLYLAAHEPEERGRDQILADLELDMTDQELEERLHKLVKADILADGSSNFRYRGLGDRIFAMVFRRIYGEEIERVSVASIEEDFKQQLDTARRQVAWHKGVAAEYKVRYRLQAASLRGATLADFTTSEDNRSLGPFTTIHKARFYLDHERSVEADLHAIHERDDGTDLMVEVKDWRQKPTGDMVRRFIEVKEALTGHLERQTGSRQTESRQTVFLFYSESGLSEKLAAMLASAGILIIDAAKLATYETPAGL